MFNLSFFISSLTTQSDHPDNEAADALAVQGAKMPIVPDDVDWESLAILQSSNADDLFS